MSARLHVALVAVVACGDNLQLHDATIDVPTLPPDLALVTSEMDGTIVITDTTFAPDACELEEGCIAAAGTRRLLRFATVTANVGDGDLVLGQVPPAGVSNETFVWSPCHMHHHVIGYADYELRDATSTVATGHKQGFCLEDDEQTSQRGPSHGYNCDFQGLSVGWADVYGNGIACQWVDITDVPAGSYTLHVTIDASHHLPDSDPTNNEWTTSIAF